MGYISKERTMKRNTLELLVSLGIKCAEAQAEQFSSLSGYWFDQLSRARAWQQIETQGFAKIPCGLSKLFIPGIFQDFKGLLEDSFQAPLWEIKDPLYFSDGEIDIGLIHRNGEVKKLLRSDEIAEGRTNHDTRKSFLHYHPHLVELLRTNGANMNGYANFLTNLSGLHSAGVSIGQAVAELFDREHGLAESDGTFLARMRDRDAFHKTRILRYPFNGSGKTTMAEGHTDQCALTVIWGKATHPGLFSVDKSHKLSREIQETSDEFIFVMPGYTFWALTYGKIPGLFHGVWEIDKRPLGEARMSAVTFLQARRSAHHQKYLDLNVKDHKAGNKKNLQEIWRAHYGITN